MSKSISSETESTFPFTALLFLLIAVPATIYFLIATSTPFLSILIAPALLVFSLLYIKPIIPYLIIIFFVPMASWRELSEGNSAFTISKIIGIVLIGVIALKTLLNPEDRKPFTLQKMFLFILLFFLFGLIATIVSPWPLNSLNDLRALFVSIIFSLLTLYFAKDRRQINLITSTVIAGGSISALIAVVADIFNISALQGSIDSQGAQTAQAMGAANDTNFFAAMLLCSIPYILKNFFSGKSHFQKFFWTVLFLLNSIGILLTYSRSVILIFFITLFLSLYYFRHRLTRTIMIQLAVLLCISSIPIAASPIGTTIAYRLSTLKNIDQDLSLSRRKSYIPVATDAFKKRPLTGWGPGNFRFLYAQSKYPRAFEKDREGFYRYAHNTFLEVIVGYGLPGIVIFFLIIQFAIKSLWKQVRNRSNNEIIDKDLAASMTVSFLSLLLSLMFLSDLHHKYLWLHIGLAMACLRIHRSQKEIEN